MKSLMISQLLQQCLLAYQFDKFPKKNLSVLLQGLNEVCTCPQLHPDHWD